MPELKPCPQCKEVPTIGYACGEYFIMPTPKAGVSCLCKSFNEMHSSKELEIEAWNRRVDSGNV